MGIVKFSNVVCRFLEARLEEADARRSSFEKQARQIVQSTKDLRRSTSSDLQRWALHCIYASCLNVAKLALAGNWPPLVSWINLALDWRRVLPLSVDVIYLYQVLLLQVGDCSDALHPLESAWGTQQYSGAVCHAVQANSDAAGVGEAACEAAHCRLCPQRLQPWPQ